MIVQWNQKQVVEDVAKMVEERLETVGEVIKTDAKRNMLRIRFPEFGLKYRRLLALYRLTWVISKDRRSISVKVGLPKGKKGSDYGFWIETGSKTAAASPWLRPALTKNLSNILRLFES